VPVAASGLARNLPFTNAKSDARRCIDRFRKLERNGSVAHRGNVSLSLVGETTHEAKKQLSDEARGRLRTRSVLNKPCTVSCLDGGPSTKARSRAAAGAVGWPIDGAQCRRE
jgi:hypothetical protein